MLKHGLIAARYGKPKAIWSAPRLISAGLLS